MAKKKSTTKSASSKSTPSAKAKTRKIKNGEYKSFRLSKRIVHPGPKLPDSFKLFKLSLRQLFSNKKLFFGIVFVYLLLTVIFVKGMALGNNLPELKTALEEVFTGGVGKIVTSVTLLSFLIGSANSASSDVAGVYQTILLIIVSLALIWALRQVHAKNKISIREAFYKGMYPLIPFVIVLVVISAQLLPLLLGSSIYSAVNAGGLAIDAGEKIVWLLLFFMLALLSLYMVSSSLFALYIVTLPDVRPLQALRSARELVKYRRWMIMRRVLFLPVFMAIIIALIMIPLILFLTPVAEWAFFILTMFSLAVVHSYMYGFYRELLPHE